MDCARFAPMLKPASRSWSRASERSLCAGVLSVPVVDRCNWPAEHIPAASQRGAHVRCFPKYRFLLKRLSIFVDHRPNLLARRFRIGMYQEQHLCPLMTDVALRSAPLRSEEHTSELQSRGHLVCRLLLEKK